MFHLLRSHPASLQHRHQILQPDIIRSHYYACEIMKYRYVALQHPRGKFNQFPSQIRRVPWRTLQDCHREWFHPRMVPSHTQLVSLTHLTRSNYYYPSRYRLEILGFTFFSLLTLYSRYRGPTLYHANCSRELIFATGFLINLYYYRKFRK